MPKMPFSKSFPMTQDWNDPRYRSSYAKFNLLGHNGQDFGTPVGTEILAPHDGRVIEALLDPTGYGWYVKIENDKEGSILAHFKEAPKVKAGDSVKQGQLVGLSGNTGNSTGPHLHWGYYRFPRKRDNGFSGTVDQTHWMNMKDQDNLVDEVIDLKSENTKLKSEYKRLEEKYSSDMGQKIEQIESLQKGGAELTAQLKVMTDQYKILSEEKNALEGHFQGLQSKLEEGMAEFKKALEESDTRIKLLEKEVTELRKKVKDGLKAFSKHELFWAWIKGVN